MEDEEEKKGFCCILICDLDHGKVYEVEERNGRILFREKVQAI